MPVYPFRCDGGHREEFFLKMDERDTPQKCSLCSRPMTRQMAAFGIATEHTSKQMYEHEQEKWALATGQKHRTAGELSDWAAKNGKAILAPGETVKKVDDLPSDREIEKALDKVYEANHDCGKIVTNAGRVK